MAAQDESTNLLNQIFDFSGAVEMITGGGGEMVSGTITTMLSTFNAFAMGAVGLVVLWIWAIAIMQTAWDGEVLGKRYSTLWAPVRTGMAVLFSAPFPGLGGLSVIHALIIGMLALSIYGANQVYGAILDYFAHNSGSLMPLATETDQPQTDAIPAILSSHLCAEYMEELTNPAMFGNSWGGPASSDNYYAEYGSSGIRWGSGSECGEINFKCQSNDSSSPEGALCEAKKQAFFRLSRRLEPVADDIWDEDNVTESAIQDAVSDYRATWQNEALGNPRIQMNNGGGYSIALTDEQQERVDDFVEAAQDEGWIMAGKWYWTLSSTSLEQQNKAKVGVEIHEPKLSHIPEYEEELLPAYARMNTYLDGETLTIGGHEIPIIKGSEVDGEEAGVGGLIEKVWFDSIGSQAHTLTGVLTSSNDPIRSLATYGQWMIGTGTSVIIGTAVLKAGTEVAEGSALGWLADKATGAVSGLGSFIGFAAGFLIAMAAWLIGLGGVLAYYIPVIPFVYWSLAVLGWAVMVIQSFLAAPLWAAAHAADVTEDGFAGRWALQGWQLLLNVMLRPILLTIGLIASMLLMHAMAFFVLEGYDTFNQSMVNSTSWISILGFLFTNTIMVIFVIIISHKAHELIFDTADDVMKWIGFGVSPLGSTRAEGEVRNMAQHAGGTVERFTGAAMGRLGGDKDDAAPHKPGSGGGGGNGGGSGGGGGGPHVPTQAGGNRIGQRTIQNRIGR